MSSVSSAASACLWISIKSVDFCLKMWNTGGLVLPFCEAFGLFSRSSCLAVFLLLVMFRSAVRVVVSN